jgi:hypothetical protein
MRLFRVLLPVLVLLAAVPASGARAQVAIVDYGIYDLEVTRRVPSPKDIAGEYNEVSEVKLRRQTDQINAVPSLNFGFRFKVTDPALFGQRLIVRKTFPRMTDTASGRTGNSAESDLIAAETDEPFINLYGFDYMWEMVEGEWTFQVLHGNRVLAEKKFKVVVAVN